jgi:hypothetical protein
VVVAVELDADMKKVGRIRLAAIPDASSDSLLPFMERNVEPGSKVLTDGWQSNAYLKLKGYHHIVKTIKYGQDTLSHAYLVFSLLKRWLDGTFQERLRNTTLTFTLMSMSFDLIVESPRAGENSSGGSWNRQ